MGKQEGDPQNLGHVQGPNLHELLLPGFSHPVVLVIVYTLGLGRLFAFRAYSLCELIMRPYSWIVKQLKL